MNAQVNFHPDDSVLGQFTRGEMSTGNAVIVSAHVQMCKTCGEKVNKLQNSAASSWEEASTPDTTLDTSNIDIAALAAEIVQTEQVKMEDANDLVDVKLEVLDEPIGLPRVIANVVEQGLKWTRLPGGVTEANLYIDEATRCEFIYIPPNSKIPEHTHRGSEMTLILHGSFHDTMGEYSRADFTLRDPQHQHQPISDEGCLCFAVIDAPLKFTRGLAKLMNPYNRYKFKTGRFRPS